MSDFSEFSGIDSHCPELLLRCVKTLEMDDKAKFEEEEDRFCLDTNSLERQMSAWGTTIGATMVGRVSSVYRHSPSRSRTHLVLSVTHPRPAHPPPLDYKPPSSTKKVLPVKTSPPDHPTQALCGRGSRACQVRAGL